MHPNRSKFIAFVNAISYYAFLLLLLYRAPEHISATSILLSTGNNIKLFVQTSSSNDQNVNNRILRDSLNSNNGMSDKWITTIDYYYELPTNKSDTTRQLSILWLDTNSRDIFKSTLRHNHRSNELAKSTKGAASYRVTPIELTRGNKLDLIQQHDNRSLSHTILEKNTSSYDFTIDRPSEKLFVSFKSCAGYQICLMSITNMYDNRKCFNISDGPATSLQVDYLAHQVVYLNKFSKMSTINLKTGSIDQLKSEMDDLPVTLTLDKEVKRIYWVSDLGSVWSSRYDGTDRRCVTYLKSRRNIIDPFSMKLIDDQLFFSDVKKRSLISIDISKQSNTENCINGQRTERDEVLIVETPTVYSFHIIDLDQEPEIFSGHQQTEFVNSISQFKVHGMDISVHSSEYTMRPTSDRSSIMLPSWTLTVICLGLIISIIIIISTLLLIAVKKRHNNYDGSKPFVNDIES